MYVIGGYCDIAGISGDPGLMTTVYSASLPRTQLYGSLDLLGLTSNSIGDSLGDQGGTIYAGSIFSNNNLEVLGQTTLWNGLSVNGPLSIHAPTGTVPPLLYVEGVSKLTGSSTLATDSTSLVGIGTLVPSTTLHVVGNLRVGTSSTSLTINSSGTLMIATTTLPDSALFHIATTTNIFTIHTTGGIVVGNPTTGDKGAGTINAQGVYDDDVLLTDYIFDKYFDGAVLPEDQDLHGSFTLLSLGEMSQYIKDNRHLPTITGRADWKQKGSISLGQLTTEIWQSVEANAIYITELNSRLKLLETPTLNPTSLSPSTPLSVLDPSLILVGQALIKSGDTSVYIKLEPPFSNLPIITISPLGYDVLGADFKYTILNITTQGFNIDLNHSLPFDLTFNYQAVSSNSNTKIYVSDSTELILNLVVVENGGDEADEGAISGSRTSSGSPTSVVEEVSIEEVPAETLIVEETPVEEVAPAEETPAEETEDVEVVETVADEGAIPGSPTSGGSRTSVVEEVAPILEPEAPVEEIPTTE